MDFPIRRVPDVVALLLLAVIVVLTIRLISLCGGHFVYTADDPYISLALADNLRHLHYGLNPGEAASPSSSILFPVLLAGLGLYGGFLVNIACSVGTVWLIARVAVDHGIVTEAQARLPAILLLSTLALGLNLVALIFVGLEAPIHILASTWVVATLGRPAAPQPMPALLAPVIVSLPLWRFEGLALAGLACLILMAHGRWRHGLGIAAAIACCLGLYALLMIRLGLPVLPSSVLVKSALTEGDGAPLRRLGAALGQPDGVVQMLLLAAILAGAVRSRRDWPVAFLAGGTLLAQLLFGGASVFGRYSAYALATGVVGALILWRLPLARFMDRMTPWRLGVGLGVLCLLGFVPIAATLLVPEAARGIYEEQVQLRRFVVDFYRAPVAANDIGLLSLDNSYGVVDLWGVSSEPARLARRAGGTQWMADLTAAHGVGLAMIYPSWFDGMIPPGWQRVAILHPLHGTVTNGGDGVSFFATDPAAVASIRTALEAFRPTLAGISVLEIAAPAVGR